MWESSGRLPLADDASRYRHRRRPPLAATPPLSRSLPSLACRRGGDARHRLGLFGLSAAMLKPLRARPPAHVSFDEDEQPFILM